MSKRSVRAPKKSDDELEKLADKANSGEDVSSHFTGRQVAKQRVNVDFPLEFLQRIDAECRRVGITRQAWIKLACDERLRQVEESLFRRKAS